MKRVDTSSWVEYLRGKDSETAQRVEALVLADAAGLCEMILLELWAGVRTHERKALAQVERSATNFPITGEVWGKSTSLADHTRRAGLTIPSTDLLVAAAASHYGLEIEHKDGHFDALAPIAKKLFPSR